MTAQSPVVQHFDSSMTPDGIRRFLETFEKPDLLENAMDAVVRTHELQALFDSMVAEQARSAAHVGSLRQHVVELTDQMQARSLQIQELAEASAKKDAQIVEFQKGRDALVLQLAKKDDEIKACEGAAARRTAEIEALNATIAEQQEAINELTESLAADGSKEEKLQALQRTFDETVAAKEVLTAELEKLRLTAEALSSEKVRLADELRAEQDKVKERDGSIRRLLDDKNFLEDKVYVLEEIVDRMPELQERVRRAENAGEEQAKQLQSAADERKALRSACEEKDACLAQRDLAAVELKQQLRAAEEEKEALIRTGKERDGALAALTEERSQLQRETAEKSVQIARLLEQVAALQHDLAARQEEMSGHERAMGRLREKNRHLREQLNLK